MKLLSAIQAGAIEEGSSLGSLLLKLRLLASRLSSDVLADWVKYEIEGYPNGIEVPAYRKVGISYRGSFSGGFGQQINNAQIPSHIVRKHCGPQWVTHELRSSVSGIEHLIENSGGDNLVLGNSSDLILLLQGNVYPDYACNEVNGIISTSQLVEALYAVRGYILELTIKIADEVPESTEITIETMGKKMSDEDAKQIANITNQTIYGSYTSVSGVGDNASININNTSGSLGELVETLSSNGILKQDAEEIARIIASEGDEKKPKGLGKRAQKWLLENLQKAVDGTWDISIDVATTLITKAAEKYYGLS